MTATSAPHAEARLYNIPPAALPGHDVIYKDPTAYGPSKSSLAVKRVVGVGDQLIHLSNHPLYASSLSSSFSPFRRRRNSGRRPTLPSKVRTNNTSTCSAFLASASAECCLLLGSSHFLPARRCCCYLGEKPLNSLDSRQLGPISRGKLVGFVEAVAWPPSPRRGLVGSGDSATRRPVQLGSHRRNAGPGGPEHQRRRCHRRFSGRPAPMPLQERTLFASSCWSNGFS